MAGLQDLIGGQSDIMALMSPEFNAVMDNRIATKNNSNLANVDVANMSITEAIQNSSAIQNNGYQQQNTLAQPRMQQQYIQQAPALNAGVITEARDFSSIDFSNTKFEDVDKHKYEEKPITKSMIVNSNMPDFLKESFLQDPPETASALNMPDSIDHFAETLKKKMGIPDKPKVQEQVSQPAQPAQRVVIRENTQASSQSDHSITVNQDIKAMIEEAVKKQMNVLYKQLRKDIVSVANQIVEQTSGNQLATIKVGDSLRFVDESGNVYEADMHFVGNKKQK